MRGDGDRLWRIWALRTKMGHLIDNLQYYFQVDVLESEFRVLMTSIQSLQVLFGLARVEGMRAGGWKDLA